MYSMDGHINHVFFFSSRRRHTRLQGDWSSDVCSSDLGHRPKGRYRPGDRGGGQRVHRQAVHAPDAQGEDPRAHGGRGDEAVTTAPEANAVKRVQDAIEAAEELIAAAGQNSAPFAAPLGELLEVIKVVVRATVVCVRPAASHALPSVATTLTALVQATETA